MITLTPAGEERLRRFIEDYGTSRVREAYHFRGKAAWLDSISEDGLLEMRAQFSADCRPHTLRFVSDEIETKGNDHD